LPPPPSIIVSTSSRADCGRPLQDMGILSVSMLIGVIGQYWMSDMLKVGRVVL
jgi:hypothetical protein